MIIAITGASGTIGTELIKKSLNEGHKVIAIVRPDSSRLNNMVNDDRVRIVHSDISGYENIEGQEKCDLFYHLAWKETFGSKRDDVFTQIDNIRYSLDAAKLAKSWGAKKFIGAGSQAEYGVSKQMLSGNSPTNPESGYGIAKYSAGKMCKLYCDMNGLEFNWGRITSTYGELESDYTLIKYLITTLLDGNVPELTKCEQIWDYTYVKDMVKALYLIGIKGINGKTYAIGSGEHRCLRDYVDNLKNNIDPDLKIKYGARPYYDHQPMLLCPDISELQRDTGYEPDYDFDTGIKNVIEYVKKQRGLS